MNKTDQIFMLSAPYDNPEQGREAKLLFVCSAGLLRSATAAHQWAIKGFNTRACGTHEYALIPLSVNLIAWADHIFFVNEENYQQATRTFKGTPEIVKLENYDTTSVLQIKDVFSRNDPELIKQLEAQIGQHGY